jgi:DNA replication initiation complex subunit (GINS family)
VGEASITTAAIIRFSENLEDSSSAFYAELAERWPEEEERFRAFAKDGNKNRRQIVRTYQETISDAYEASYSFEGVDLESYAIDTALSYSADFAADLELATALENTACAFYLDVAARSESLLATIPRAFKRVAAKRNQRKQDLETMLKEARASS